jgi:hypothetical protein
MMLGIGIVAHAGASVLKLRDKTILLFVEIWDYSRAVSAGEVWGTARVGALVNLSAVTNHPTRRG